MAELERRTLAEQVYHRLRAAILNDEFAPGAELQEPALAVRFSVSRGPVREALRLLTADGLVTIVPRVGARVRMLTRKEFGGVYRVRAALEELAVRQAVPLLTQADLGELRKHLGDIEKGCKKNDLTMVLDANRSFHFLFVSRSDNFALQAAYGQVGDLVARYQRRSMTLRGDMSLLPATDEDLLLVAARERADRAGGFTGDDAELDDDAWRRTMSVEEHRAIYEAAVQGDAELAAEMTKRHILIPTEHLDDYLPEEAPQGVVEVTPVAQLPTAGTDPAAGRSRRPIRLSERSADVGLRAGATVGAATKPAGTRRSRSG